VLRTVVGDPFTKWVDTQMEIRNNTQKIIKNLDIAVTEAAFNAFNRSSHFSCKILPFLISIF
jgi:hypothetical protein